jgi:diguanylate cyclase (GGDEF)-like protein/PAS domain S-box-containing protein
MVEETDDAFVLFDSTLHVVFANKAIFSLTGKPESDFLGLHLTEFIRTLDQNSEGDLWVNHGKPLLQGRDIEIRRLNLPTKHVAMRLESVTSHKEGAGYVLVVLSDITARKRAEEKLQLAANVFSHAREGIMITDSDGTIIDINETLVQMTGYGREELLGRNPRIFKSGRHNRDYYLTMWGDLARDGHWHGEIWNRRKDGRIYPELKTISAVRDDKGVIRQYVSLSSDITQQKEHEDQLVHIAHHDNLTGLPNRALLTDRLIQALAQARRDKGMSALMFLDLDKFKPVNDNFGHEIGDMLLRDVAKRLQECLKREADTVSRLGGDEFVILLPQIDTETDAAIVADKVITSLSQPFYIEQHIINISTSIGVAIYPVHGTNMHILMKNADGAMYDAKAAGRGCFRFYSEHVVKQQTDATLRADADAELSRRSRNKRALPVSKVDHELQVHQIELEMQDNELRRVNTDLEAARDRYLDLYDHSPVAYLTLSESGVIEEANLTATNLIGVVRSKLINTSFSSCLSPEDGDRWNLFFRSQQPGSEKRSIRLNLINSKGQKLKVHVHVLVTKSKDKPLGMRITISDISEEAGLA